MWCRSGTGWLTGRSRRLSLPRRGVDAATKTRVVLGTTATQLEAKAARRACSDGERAFEGLGISWGLGTCRPTMRLERDRSRQVAGLIRGLAAERPGRRDRAGQFRGPQRRPGVSSVVVWRLR